jgi:hypothetical protein
MALFPKIKKILEQQEICVLSKAGNPEYVVMKWGEFQKIKDNGNQLEKLKAQVEAESEEENYDIDINKIPV